MCARESQHKQGAKGRGRGSSREPDWGLTPGPGSRPELKAEALLMEPPGVSQLIYFLSSFLLRNCPVFGLLFLLEIHRIYTGKQNENNGNGIEYNLSCQHCYLTFGVSK